MVYLLAQIEEAKQKWPQFSFKTDVKIIQVFQYSIWLSEDKHSWRGGAIFLFLSACFLVGAIVEQINEKEAFSEHLMPCAILYSVLTLESANWF